MIETIRVERVLRETVTTPYAALVTRTTGAAVRHRIEIALEASGSVVVLLDFSDVALLDCSCADEIVAKLLRPAADGRTRFVALRGLRPDHRDSIEHVLERHGIAVCGCGDLGIEAVGQLPEEVRRALLALATERDA